MIIPKKSLGQNFLNDKNIVKKITNLTNIKNQTVIEVGPGLGFLTDEIIKLKPKKLILIEKDYHLLNILNNKYKKFTNVEIFNEDALKFKFNNYSDIKIISNLPYNISSKFLLKVLILNKNIIEIICMIQKELAEKFEYRTGKMNKYKFLNQYTSMYKIEFKVSSNVFFPKPKVKSSVVKFKLHQKDINSDKLQHFLTNFFKNKRKKIKSNSFLKNLNDNYLINNRYEDLKYDDVLKIYKRFKFSIS